MLATPTRAQPRSSPDGTEGYSCTLYKDHLVLYGGKENGDVAGDVNIYNLKKKERQNSSYGAALLFPRTLHSACLSPDTNSVVFYGGQNQNTAPIENLTLALTENQSNSSIL